jgi:hypothetical protein
VRFSNRVGPIGIRLGGLVSENTASMDILGGNPVESTSNGGFDVDGDFRKYSISD